MLGLITSRARKPAVALALAAAFTIAHAQDDRAPEGQAQGQARNAAIADGVTTAVGLAAGAAEMNPLGAAMTVGMKFVTLRYASTLPDTEQPAVYAAANSMWQGATVNNVCVTAAVLSGGAFAPACVALGVAWGLKVWKDTEHERTFWEGCAMLREYAHEPQLKCVYTAPAATVAQAAPRETAVDASR